MSLKLTGNDTIDLRQSIGLAAVTSSRRSVEYVHTPRSVNVIMFVSTPRLVVSRLLMLQQVLEFYGNCVAAADDLCGLTRRRALFTSTRMRIASTQRLIAWFTAPTPAYRLHRPLITTNNFSSIIDDVRASQLVPEPTGALWPCPLAVYVKSNFSTEGGSNFVKQQSPVRRHSASAMITHCRDDRTSHRSRQRSNYFWYIVRRRMIAS